jgi:hypothetical protein
LSTSTWEIVLVNFDSVCEFGVDVYTSSILELTSEVRFKFWILTLHDVHEEIGWICVIVTLESDSLEIID